MLYLYLILIALFLAAGYLVTAFSNAFYIDPEEIQSVFPDISDRRRRQLERFTSDPRAFFQIAFLVRISSALVVGILAFLFARRIAAWPAIPATVAYIILFVFFWFATVTLFIYLPRRISLQDAKKRLIGFLPFMNLVYRISYPVMSFLSRLSLKPGQEIVDEEHKEDIVERAIETLAESAGIGSPIIEEDEREMIEHIFQLDITEVEEIMIPRISVIGFEKGTGLEAIVDTVRKYGYSRYPVYDGTIDSILGIVPVKDLLLLDDEQKAAFNLVDHIRAPLRVGEHKKIDQLLSEFKKTQTHMAIVIDEFGGTSGLVTLEDILEEIVGDIQDEHDGLELRQIVHLSNGNLEVSGACPLEDLADELGIDLEQDEFETVGGMIYDLVGSIPAEGTQLSWENSRLKVLEVDGQRIKKILVVPPYDS